MRPVRPGRRRHRRRARLVRRPTRRRRAQAAELAAELAGLLFAPRPTGAGAATVRAGRRTRRDGDRAGGLPAAGRRRGRQPLRRRRRAAAVPDGCRRRRSRRRPGRRGAGPGDDGDVHQPRAGDHGHAALAGGSRRAGRRSPSPLGRLAACPGGDRGGGSSATRPRPATRDGPSSSPSGPATDIVHSIALDLLTLAYLVDDDIAEAVRIARRRLELLGTLAVGPLSGFEFADGHLMAAEVDLAAGDLAGAAAHAEALARLPFYRDEDHLAMSRRLLVDALAGHFDDVVRTGERFRTGWERAGRPVAPNLARTSYAVAMVHGMRGDDDRRAAWVRLTIDLGVDARAARRRCARLAGGVRRPARAPSRRPGRGRAATRRRHRRPRGCSGPGQRTVAAWYAALWAEAAVLAHHPDAAARIERSRHAARDNPIATAIVERAAAIATGDRERSSASRSPSPSSAARTSRQEPAGSRPACEPRHDSAASASATCRRSPTGCALRSCCGCPARRSRW